MTDDACFGVSETIRRFERDDFTVEQLCLSNANYEDRSLTEVFLYLFTYHNNVKALYLYLNKLTDVTGVKIAQFVESSKTIEIVSIWGNQFSEITYVAMANALRVNTSLRIISMNQNLSIDSTRVSRFFVDALRINPNRPINTKWHLFDQKEIEYDQIKDEAEELGHPTLQMLLCHYLDAHRFQSIIKIRKSCWLY